MSITIDATDAALLYGLLGQVSVSGEVLDRVARIRAELKPLLPAPEAPEPEAPQPEA